MTTEQAIENILKEQINTYRTLHEVLSRERECLVKINVELVEELSKEKDTVVMRLRLLEEERQRLIKVFIEENDVPGEMNLNELGRLTGNDNFPALRSEMISLLKDIEEMNKFNSILINRSLKYVKTTTNFITTFKTENAVQNTGVLLSRET